MAAILILALARVAAGLASSGPEPTPSELGTSSLHEGFTPRPTHGPDLNRVDLKLFKRQALPNVCGYESGSILNSITCSFGRTCYFYTRTGVWGMRGCCTGTDSLNCGWVTSCVDATAATDTASCNSDCQNDPFVSKCTGLLAPYCHSYRYPGASVVDYGCEASPYSSWRTIETTYLGQLNPTFNFRFASLSLTDAEGLPSRTYGYGATDSASPDEDTGLSGLPSDRPAKKGTNVGAIAGGAIGGLAVLAALVAGIVFLLYRRRRRRRQQLAVAGPPDAGTQYAPGPPPPPGYGPVAQDAPPAMQQPFAQAPHEYFTPVPGKVELPYNGSAPKTSPPPPHSPAPSSEPTLAGATPLPAYNRGSYMSVPAQDPFPPPQHVHQLHSDSASPPPPAANAYQLHGDSASPPPPPPPPAPPINRVPVPQPGAGHGPIYEAPTHEARS